MHVREMLTRKAGPALVTIPHGADVATAARLLLEHRIGGLPVVGADGTIQGFVSERDIVQALYRSPRTIGTQGVQEVMRSPAPRCDANDSPRSVMERMTRERLRHLVVFDGDRLVGVLSIGDFVKHRISELETEAGVLRDVVVAQRTRR
jgi:CBS domain-containing protein